ncbi:MAG: glycoside hydrolase family 13 protein [Acidobacteriaceae bacterium]|nr:glycoside hydrolase family 13 protein [Acidobacteriaceae bacterium]
MTNSRRILAALLLPAALAPIALSRFGQAGGFDPGATAAFLHDTFDSFYRSAEGAVPENTAVTLRFRTAHFGADSVTVRAYLLDTGSGQTTGPVDTAMVFDQNITSGGVMYDAWKTAVTMPSKPTIFYYKFIVKHGESIAFYSDDYVDNYDNLNKGGTGVASATEPFDSFQITVYDPQFKTPSWLHSANVYQIFPDRFRNGNPGNDYCVPNSSSGCPSLYGEPQSETIAVHPWNSLLCDPRDPNGACANDFGNVFYGGDLTGIQQKLTYLRDVGFDTIYLTPIFQASSNHRYDTDDFLHVDPALGGDPAFAALVSAVHAANMHLILDAVFNHASSDSMYFNRYNRFSSPGACQSLSSPYRSWFEFNNQHVPCTTGDYAAWAGVDTLPAFNHNQAAVQQLFYSGLNSVLHHWYEAGAAGWRFDAADDPNFQHSWWTATRKFAKQYSANGPLIGEIWPDASAWLAGDQFDSVMNYRFRRNVLGFARGPYDWSDENDNGADKIVPLSPSQFDHANRAVRDDYPDQATAAMLNLLDSHDTNRALFVLTILGDNGLQQAKERLQLAAAFQFTYTGAPMILYGDEVAINAPSRSNGANGPIGDPYVRAPFPWTDQPGDPSVYGPPDNKITAFYTTLAHLRRQHPALTGGSFVTLLTGDTQQAVTAPNTYAFARVLGNDVVVTVLNNGTAANSPAIPVAAYFADGTAVQDALAGKKYTASGGNITLILPPRTAVILTR